MVERFATTELYRSLSRARLNRYQSPSNADDIEMLTNYYWNASLCATLTPVLHLAEIALRNSLDAVLRHRYNTPLWWRVSWQTRGGERYLLLEKQRQAIVEVEKSFRREKRLSGYSPVSPDVVVSRLNFGFWTTILSPDPYDSRIWRYQRGLLLKQAFPFAQNLPLHEIHNRFNRIRMLRNRVMHHEPIFDLDHLGLRYVEIHEAIRWISPELRETASLVDVFPDAHANGRARIRQMILTANG